MTSEAQKNAGYLIPEQITDHELLCVQFFIPNDILYIGAFTGQLNELGVWFNWEKSYTPGDTRASEAAAYWRYLIDTYLCIQFNKPKEDDGMPCCDDDALLFRFTADGVYQSSSDGGITWEDAPELDPRNNGVAAPPLAAPSPNTKCAAADNMRDQVKAIRDQVIALLTAGTTVLAILAGIVGFIGAILGISGAATGIGVLLIGVAAFLLTLTPESVEEQIDDEVLDQLRCIFFCHIEDNGQATYGEWQEIISDIDSTFTNFPQQFLHAIVAGLGYIGLSNAGTMGVLSASDCSECGCVEGCDFPAELFYLGTVTDIVTNPDGTITVSIASADDGGGAGTQAIKWGNSPTFDQCCCIDNATIPDPVGATNFDITPCVGSPFSSAVFVAGQMRSLVIYQNGAFTTPFHAVITFAGETCE